MDNVQHSVNKEANKTTTVTNLKKIFGLLMFYRLLQWNNRTLWAASCPQTLAGGSGAPPVKSARHVTHASGMRCVEDSLYIPKWDSVSSAL